MIIFYSWLYSEDTFWKIGQNFLNFQQRDAQEPIL